ncbi:MAG TPA: DegQ family serine endoprotease [Nitrospirota bacterium]|nr:DegQ family serine endoprotease [Nitrospirota bacterium]
MRRFITNRHSTLFLMLLIAVVLGSGFITPDSTALARDKAVSQDTIKFLGKLSDALAEMADAVRPSVVNISTTSTVTTEDNPQGDLFNDPFFRHFFGDQPGHQKRKYKSAALGSGVIFSENGYILTNNHVVKGAEEIKVVLSDKREFKGKIVGTDPRTDLAVIKINARDLPAAKLGDSSKLKTGDIVLAVGTPFGLNSTVTMGIVSAVGRSNVGVADFEDFIQTDAAINPGNSGGALVNTNGEVVGINTAIFSTSGGYMGVGFAIPSDMAKTVMDSIIKHGKVVRGWLGVSIQDLTPDIAKSLGIKQQTGALVADVVKDSPAEKAGLKRGDVIVTFDGKPVEDSTSLRNMVSAAAPGKSVKFKLLREGKELAVTATLSEFKERKAVKKVEYDNVLKGITVQELTASLRDQIGVPENMNGVVITDVGADSPAQGILQAGDVVPEVNRHEISTISDYERVVSKIGKEDPVLLLIYREGGTIYITLRP